MHRLMGTVVATSVHSALLQKPTLFAQKADCRTTFFAHSDIETLFSPRLGEIDDTLLPYNLLLILSDLRPLLFPEFGLERKLTF